MIREGEKFIPKEYTPPEVTKENTGEIIASALKKIDYSNQTDKKKLEILGRIGAEIKKRKETGVDII